MKDCVLPYNNFCLISKGPKVATESTNPKIAIFDHPTVICCPLLQKTFVNICIILILPKTRVHGLHYCHYSMGLSLFKCLWLAPKTHIFWNTMHNGHSGSSGTSRKSICDLLLVINSNLGLTLHCFRDIAGFLLKTATLPQFCQNLTMFPLD